MQYFGKIYIYILLLLSSITECEQDYYPQKAVLCWYVSTGARISIKVVGNDCLKISRSTISVLHVYFNYKFLIVIG